MGYYIDLVKSDWYVPIENENAAFQALKDLNRPENNHLKSGGSFGPDGKKSVFWYSWMPEDYDAHAESVADVLEMLGFECLADSTGTRITGWYQEKMGDERVFLNALAPYVPDGSYLEWRGEDFRAWRYFFSNGTMIEQQGTIFWGPRDGSKLGSWNDTINYPKA